jgi:hypothetical protein
MSRRPCALAAPATKHALIANGHYDSALIALDRAQELDPYSIDISQSRLIVLRKLHRYRQYFKDLMDSTLRIWRSQQH